MIFRKFVLIIWFVSIASFVFAAQDDSGESSSVEATPAVTGSLGVPAASDLAEGQSKTGESDQTINGFSLAGYGEKGKKTWDLAGKTADIFTDVVKLSDVIGNLYGKEDNIKLTADQGDFNKKDGKVHLEHNVVITTTSGMKLFTNSLDWDRKNEAVSTKDIVNIKRDNLVATAKGAWGNPTLKKVSLIEYVRLDITPAAEKGKAAAEEEKITITCDGPLEIDYEKNIAVFKDNVKVLREGSTIYSDTMDVYFITAGAGEAKVAPAGKEGAAPMGMMGSKIDKIVARGHVKVIRGENISTSEEAIYSGQDKKLVLMGKPKLLIYSTKDFSNAPAGDEGPL
jgi:LPS export ABC transporter protein LptC